MQQTIDTNFTGTFVYRDNKKWSTLNNILESVYGTNNFVKNITEGNTFTEDTMYTKNDFIDISQDFKYDITKDNCKKITNSEILSSYTRLINGEEKNESFDKLINLIKNDESFKKYSLYELYYLLMKLRCFSYLGHEEFNIWFNETDDIISLKMTFMSPLTDETNFIFLMRKIVKIIYNKNTGLYLLTELSSNNFLYYNYVYNYETSDCLIKSTSKIFNKDYTEWWLGYSNIYYINNGYYVRRENVQHVKQYCYDEKTDTEFYREKFVIGYMYELPNNI